jgi:hypothetical protein
VVKGCPRLLQLRMLLLPFAAAVPCRTPCREDEYKENSKQTRMNAARASVFEAGCRTRTRPFEFRPVQVPLVLSGLEGGKCVVLHYVLDEINNDHSR